MGILDPGYYSEDELKNAGFKGLGKNVVIGRNSTFIGLENISIGNNVRIDGNVTVAAKQGHFSVGDFVHIGGGSHFSCSGGIELASFVTISQGVRVYSASDDYSGNSLTNPMTPKELRNEVRGLVKINEHVIIGSGSVVLPSLNLGTGAAVGALSLVKGDLDEWSIYAGSPAKKIRDRSRGLLELPWEELN